MRRILVAIILALTPFSVGGVELDIGGTTIRVPTPAGLAHLTSDIQPMYDVSIDMTTPQNERLVTFVDEAIIPEALSGEMPTFERYINVEIMRDLKSTRVTAADFAEFKKMAHAQLEQTIRSMEQKMPGMMENMSERVGDTLDMDVAFSLNNVVPLPIHQESERTIASSSIVKYDMAATGSASDHIVTSTSTFVFLKGRIIFVYVYGGPKDLTWTRDQAERWIDEVIVLNTKN